MKKFVLCCMSAVMILGASTLSSSAANSCGSWSKYTSNTYCGTPVCYDNASRAYHTKTTYQRKCRKANGSSYYEYKNEWTTGNCC